MKTYYPRLFSCWERKILSGSLKAKKAAWPKVGFLDGTRCRLLSTQYNCFSSLQLLTSILRRGGFKSQDRELIIIHKISIPSRNLYQVTELFSLSKDNHSRNGTICKWLQRVEAVI